MHPPTYEHTVVLFGRCINLPIPKLLKPWFYYGHHSAVTKIKSCLAKHITYLHVRPGTWLVLAYQDTYSGPKYSPSSSSQPGERTPIYEKHTSKPIEQTSPTTKHWCPVPAVLSTWCVTLLFDIKISIGHASPDQYHLVSICTPIWHTIQNGMVSLQWRKHGLCALLDQITNTCQEKKTDLVSGENIHIGWAAKIDSSS